MFDRARQQTALHSAYPERSVPCESWFDRQGVKLASPVMRRLRERTAMRTEVVEPVNELGRALAGLRDDQLRQEAVRVREQLRRDGFSNELVFRSFALVREVAQRTIGQRHYDVQILGGWVLLNGCVAEMATGEGKTLTATLAAATAALAGVPVHIITVNDYLTARDADEMGPIYRMLGLTVGMITHEQDPAAHRAAYACDVTYCTNKELAFDYLRDRLAVGRQPIVFNSSWRNCMAMPPDSGIWCSVDCASASWTKRTASWWMRRVSRSLSPAAGGRCRRSRSTRWCWCSRAPSHAETISKLTHGNGAFA